MAYVEGRTIHDADSHVVEAPDFLDNYVEAAWREKVREAKFYGKYGSLIITTEELRQRHDDPGYRAERAQKIMTRKNYNARWVHGAARIAPRRWTTWDSPVSSCFPRCR